MLPLLFDEMGKLGGLGLGGGVDLPKECFFGDEFKFKETEVGGRDVGGREAGCLAASFLTRFFLPEVALILSELPFNFSRLELAELVVEPPRDFLLVAFWVTD